MGYAKPTQARLIDQRARRRATQDLIEAHREEFDALYRKYREAAEAEAEVLAAKAAEEIERGGFRTFDRQHGVPLGDAPPRLMPGARKPGETSLDRIDVARCPFCVGYHDRGHACRSCGARPGLSEVHEHIARRAANNGLSRSQVAAQIEETR